METYLAYDRDPRLRELEATIVTTGQDDLGPWVVLDDTIFYPEGGGQPWDTGTINGVNVLQVRKHDEGVRHYVQEPLLLGPAHLLLNWPRRFEHMQHHTGQHLLSAVAEKHFGWATTAFHLGDLMADVELAVPQITPEKLQDLEDAVAQEIRAAHPVRIHRVSLQELHRFPELRSRGLPKGFQGPARIVEIEGVDWNTCGGTHLRHTAEIEALALVGTEPMRGGTRVYFVAGTRLRRRLHEHETRNRELRKIFGAADHELTLVAQMKLSELSVAERNLRHAHEELAMVLGQRFASETATVTVFHREEADLAFLQRLARGFLSASREGVLLATGGREPQGHFVLATNRPDVQTFGVLVARELDGRGGGSGSVYQGKASRISRRGEVAQQIERMLASEPFKRPSPASSDQ